MNTSKDFYVKSTSSFGIASDIIASSNKFDFPPIKLSIPPEFMGPGLGYSPEDLYALSLLNCYIATFKFVAEKSKLSFLEISGEAKLEVGDSEEQKNWMRAIYFKINLSGASAPERALNLMEKTKNNCMIHQSVKTKIFFEFSVS